MTHMANSNLICWTKRYVSRAYCRTYWGTHGCALPRLHDGPCWCDCCECQQHPDPDSGCVGGPPYYGPETEFFGEDVKQKLEVTTKYATNVEDLGAAWAFVMQHIDQVGDSPSVIISPVWTISSVDLDGPRERERHFEVRRERHGHAGGAGCSP
jgi:hypothetical protein